MTPDSRYFLGYVPPAHIMQTSCHPQPSSDVDGAPGRPGSAGLQPALCDVRLETIGWHISTPFHYLLTPLQAVFQGMELVSMMP